MKELGKNGNVFVMKNLWVVSLGRRKVDFDHVKTIVKSIELAFL